MSMMTINSDNKRGLPFNRSYLASTGSTRDLPTYLLDEAEANSPVDMTREASPLHVRRHPCSDQKPRCQKKQKQNKKYPPLASFEPLTFLSKPTKRLFPKCRAEWAPLVRRCPAPDFLRVFRNSGYYSRQVGLRQSMERAHPEGSA